MVLSLSTNLIDIPLQNSQFLAACLSKNDLWLKIVDDIKENIYYMSHEDLDRFQQLPNAGEALLRLWGNRGQTVMDLLSRLQALSKHYGKDMDQPQLILMRKFKEVRWTSADQIVVSIVNDSELRLECKAVGFPWPEFQWIQSNDQSIENATTSAIIVPRCICSANQEYRCTVRNEAPDGFFFSNFYRQPHKTFQSSITSKPVDLVQFVGDKKCPKCETSALEQLREMMGGVQLQSGEIVSSDPQPQPLDDDALIAADKVALIISNCSYRYLPELVTPHCDAETLAIALQDMKYKTVTLADLTLDEMKQIIKEYRKLLGNGVYAVFYFCGHGFEVNGQCYLLPIEAPLDAHHPQHALSMDWVLSVFADCSPALNLMLLDVCRKFIPFNCIADFVVFAEQFKAKNKPNRNTVYGYSTSGGVGAYEVRGEVNGVFMKYLKERISLNVSVVDMINFVLRDIENDEKVRDVQVPELRSTLTRTRSLMDPLVYDGHTVSYDHHTIHWRLMHELPNPVYVQLPELALTVTIWFDFCGHFTNKVYVFSSVGDIVDEEADELDCERALSPLALSHLAFLRFPEDLETSNERLFSDDEEGVSLCLMLSNLQRAKGEISCVVELKHKDDMEKVVCSRSVVLGHVLITRIDMKR